MTVAPLSIAYSNRGQRCANTRVVVDHAVFDRHIEVDADERAFPSQIEVANREFGHCDLGSSSASL